jgi:hypothetical protein
MRILSTGLPLLMGAGLVLFTQKPVGASSVLNFETFPDGTPILDSTPVTTQFPGLTFSNTIILTAGISLNEFEFPPRSGSNVASDNGGPITITFAAPVQSFSGYFTYGHSLTLQAFGSTNNLVASAVSRFSINEALSGATGSQPNELLQVSFSGGISKVTITGDPAGTSFTLDDMNAGNLPSSVPSPVPTVTPPVLLVLAVLIGLIGARASGRKGSTGVALKSILACGFILPLLVVCTFWMNAQVQTQTPATTAPRDPQPTPNVYLLRSHLSANPDRIMSGRATTVTLTARISHPGHIPGNLLRLDASGNATNLGRLKDDGKNDPGVSLYSIRVPFNESVAGQIRLQVSVAIRGQMRRVLSEPITLTITSEQKQ